MLSLFATNGKNEIEYSHECIYLSNLNTNYKFVRIFNIIVSGTLYFICLVFELRATNTLQLPATCPRYSLTCCLQATLHAGAHTLTHSP